MFLACTHATAVLQYVHDLIIGQSNDRPFLKALRREGFEVVETLGYILSLIVSPTATFNY